MQYTRLTLWILFATALSIWACDSSSSSDKPIGKANIYEHSEAIYQQACASCHGVEVAAFADRTWEYGAEKDSIIQVIAHGLPEEDMPGYDSVYSAGAIDSLATYILTIREKIEAYQFADASDSSDVFSAEAYDLKLDTVMTDMKSPWGMAFLPGGDLLVTDKAGKLYRVDKMRNQTEIKGVPEVHYAGQGGLFEVLLHPEFETNNWLYLSYASSQEEDGETLAATMITRAKLDGDQLKDAEVIFEANTYLATGHHYGGRMEFAADGTLYVSVGDRGKRDDNPQAMDRYPGKIHRINADGSIPEDNPFADQQGVVPSIYSYGHRNPQGMAIHPETGAVWTHEHGPRGGDEINIVRPRLNYGWPVVSYGINYSGTTFTDKVKKAGMEDPLHYWVPSIAPSGMTFITGDRYPDWEGDLLVGSLKYRYLERIVLDGEDVIETEPLLKKIGRVRSVAMGPDGYIYVGVEGNPGFVVRLVPEK